MLKWAKKRGEMKRKRKENISATWSDKWPSCVKERSWALQWTEGQSLNKDIHTAGQRSFNESNSTALIAQTAHFTNTQREADSERGENRFHSQKCQYPTSQRSNNAGRKMCLTAVCASRSKTCSICFSWKTIRKAWYTGPRLSADTSDLFQFIGIIPSGLGKNVHFWNLQSGVKFQHISVIANNR